MLGAVRRISSSVRRSRNPRFLQLCSKLIVDLYMFSHMFDVLELRNRRELILV